MVSDQPANPGLRTQHHMKYVKSVQVQVIPDNLILEFGFVTFLVAFIPHTCIKTHTREVLNI